MFVMEKCYVSFEGGTEFLNTILTVFDFKGLIKRRSQLQCRLRLIEHWYFGFEST
jgi:hypothetical protein